jgi:hypothetical protein
MSRDSCERCLELRHLRSHSFNPILAIAYPAASSTRLSRRLRVPVR